MLFGRASILVCLYSMLTTYTRLCFEIPCAGGHLLETGTEAFLTLKRDGKLGNSMLIDHYRFAQMELTFG